MNESVLRIATVKRWIKESIDLDYYDLLYTLQLFMSGSKVAIEKAMEGTLYRCSTIEVKGQELPNYSDIMPGIGQVGVQNHGLINARINVQGLSLEPGLVFAHDNPLVREWNQQFFIERSQQEDWAAAWYMTGMELEANGISSCRAGVTDGRVDWRHTPNLDCLWDRAKRSPAGWRWACDRDRLTPEDVIEVYGDALTDEQIRQLTEDEPQRLVNLEGGFTGRTNMRQIIEWQFYSDQHHVVFLGSIFGANSIALRWNSKKDGYEQVPGYGTPMNPPVAAPEGDYALGDGELGPNIYGVLPKAWWVDSWAPGIHRPVAKLETTMRLAAILNEVEWYMVEVLRNGVPITAMDVSKVTDPDLKEEILSCRSAKGLRRLISINGGSVRDLLSRTEPMALPEVCVYLRQMLKDEINAATGVQDMQRGQALGGERRTREEIVRFMDASGVQARHLRESFARFLTRVVYVTRPIAAKFDSVDTTLQLPSYGSVKTSQITPALMCGMDLPVQVDPYSLVFKTEEDRRQEAVSMLQTVFLPLMNIGMMMQTPTLDPRKVAQDVLRKFGYKDPLSELGYSPSQLGQMGQQQAGAPSPTGQPGQPPTGEPGLPTPSAPGQTLSGLTSGQPVGRT